MTERTIALLAGATGHPLVADGDGARCPACRVRVVEDENGPDRWTAADGSVTPTAPPCERPPSEVAP